MVGVVNIADVARHAGVSRSTVSYVLSGKRPISEATRERVRQSIEALAFRRDPAALALTTRRTWTVGLAATLTPNAPKVDIVALDDFVMSIAFALRSEGYDMLLLAQQATEQIQRLQRGLLVDALIVMDVLWDEGRLPLLARAPYPVVLMGEPGADHDLSIADLDYQGAGRLAVEHLHALGHRRIAVVSGPQGLNSVERVERGAAEVPDIELTILKVWDAAPLSRRQMQLVMDSTAVVLHDQTQLPTLLHALHQRTIAMPRDMSVIAIATETALPEPITTVVVPVDEIAAAAVHVAIDAIDGAGSQRVLLAPRLIDRGTTSERQV
ncbi:LacI family DNA-binding transcriptional regulator [Demequina lutea]|uniref:LacI family DNA-binding transcriptional regulator n=1 Tax=Demequina lutea TaxID=431489 RepID=UPI00078457E0|nr:LacI family DNA-binding transcriptional regulator [Demequina lutea]